MPKEESKAKNGAKQATRIVMVLEIKKMLALATGFQ
jgi:hypothetical protein